MVAALAEGLGMSVEEIQSRIDQAVMPYQIAQAQVDWMDQHMEQMWQNGGAGIGPCHGGTAGAGVGVGR